MRSNEAYKDDCLLRMLRWLWRVAPNATVKECMDWASDYADSRMAKSDHETALAILCEVLGCGHSGNLPPSLIDKHREDPAALWAMWRTVEAHGSVACSPFSGGMEKLKQVVNDDLKSANWQIPCTWQKEEVNT